ncbi:MAG: hypothetical protein AB7Q42_11430 [Acidimicrobiia bacterium]
MTSSSSGRSVGGALFLALALLTACADGGDDTTAGADSIVVLDTAGAAVTDGNDNDGEIPVTQPVIDTQAPPDTAVEPLPETTPPAVSTVVLGGVVGGSSGGVGEDSTDSASEVVRNEDGSCTGWDGRRDGGAWTAEFAPGATVTILDSATDEEIGTGEIVEGVAENVATTDDDEQWQCWLRFEATATRPAEQYAIRVGGARPVALAADPTRDGFVIGSISTPADSLALDACADADSLPEVVGDWSAVGQYWNNGVSSLCFAGLTVPEGAIERTCRPAGIASDHVVSVVDARDPSIVYDDASGLQVDPATLEPGTPVIVNVSNGIPCG